MIQSRTPPFRSFKVIYWIGPHIPNLQTCFG